MYSICYIVFTSYLQVGLGWIGDLPWVNITKTYAACLIGCGGTIVLFPILIRVMDAKESYSFYILALNSLIFGLTFSSSYSYTPSILVELIALERFTMAYGLVLLSQGIGHLIGPPMAGKRFHLFLINNWIMLSINNKVPSKP